MSAANDFVTYYAKLKKILAEPKNEKQLLQAVVDAPFHNKLYTTTLDLGIIVLLFVNAKAKTIDRIALSNTDPADWAVRMTPMPFHEIKIPVGHKTNIIAKAIKAGRPQKTTDWKYLFIPALAEESARFNQAGAGIACSFVYPLESVRSGAAMIFSYYQPFDQLDKQHEQFMKTYTKLVAKALG